MIWTHMGIEDAYAARETLFGAVLKFLVFSFQNGAEPIMEAHQSPRIVHTPLVANAASMPRSAFKTSGRYLKIQNTNSPSARAKVPHSLRTLSQNKTY